MRVRAVLLIFGTILPASLCHAPEAQAQTAADKATAREAATEGIKLYQAGKYGAALDRLKRAEALYDAPVHLLYIARSQAKLGLLVEASENYRLLDRYSLPKNAPGAWTSAVQDGRKELTLLEPRIPSLRIVSKPAALASPALTIDGAPVSAAVIGISRPANPGKHHIELSAPGYSPSKAEVELPESESKDVLLTLAPQQGYVPPSASAPASSQPMPTSTGGVVPPKPSSVGFLAGLRLGMGFPNGTILHLDGLGGFGAEDVDSSDVLRPGAGAEIHVGVRFARYFTPVFYVEGEALGAKDGAGLKGVSNASSGSAGLGIIIGTPRNRTGGFGELDLALNAFSLTTKSGLDQHDCKLSASGGALRLGGGAVFPIGSWLHLTPMVMATFGRFGTLTADSGCVGIKSGSISDDDARIHGMLFIGVGGDAVLGNDRP